MNYYVRTDVTYQSKSYADEINLAWVPKRFVTNASIGLGGDYYDVQLWFRNLFDKKYAAVASIQQPNVKYDSTLGERRTIGVTVSLKFNGGAAPRREEPAAAPPPSPPRAAAPAPAPAPIRQAPAAPAVPQKFLVFFDWDRSNLRSDGSQIVSDAANYARTNGRARIETTGHADTSGANAYNLGLSQRRAEAVKAELVRLGIPAGEIVVLFKGEEAPLVATGDGVREPQNRRVEIVME
jgi:outer membrane protein OmpA-like peptidoglycan-associated protein